MGTLVNVIAILLGSFIGLTFKKLINKDLEKSLNDIMGLSVVFMSGARYTVMQETYLI